MKVSEIAMATRYFVFQRHWETKQEQNATVQLYLVKVFFFFFIHTYFREIQAMDFMIFTEAPQTLSTKKTLPN